jgi:hypothetical protein
MNPEVLRLLIQSKLTDGRLPLNSIPRVWGGPGNGETCDACEHIITKHEFVMEGISLAGGKAALQLHVGCFWLWDEERRPQLAALALSDAPIAVSAPATSLINGQMNGCGVTGRSDEE